MTALSAALVALGGLGLIAFRWWLAFAKADRGARTELGAEVAAAEKRWQAERDDLVKRVNRLESRRALED